jgi:hypothetical protein
MVMPPINIFCWGFSRGGADAPQQYPDWDEEYQGEHFMADVNWVKSAKEREFNKIQNSEFYFIRDPKVYSVKVKIKVNYGGRSY